LIQEKIENEFENAISSIEIDDKIFVFIHVMEYDIGILKNFYNQLTLSFCACFLKNTIQMNSRCRFSNAKGA